MMTLNQLREHDDTLQAMARTGTLFKDIPGWVLHVAPNDLTGTFDACGYPESEREDVKRIRYAAVRKHYAAKKEWFAKCPDHYTPSKPRGETYRYTLKDPYRESEIEEYEAAAGERLPDELRDYLLRVSRELYTYSYPVVFDLTNTDVGTCGIPDGQDWFDGYGDQEGCDDDDFRRVEDGMAEIGCGGCAFSDLIVLKGNRRGTMWHSDGYAVSLAFPSSLQFETGIWRSGAGAHYSRRS
jgi:hypothetical protein